MMFGQGVPAKVFVAARPVDFRNYAELAIMRSVGSPGQRCRFSAVLYGSPTIRWGDIT